MDWSVNSATQSAEQRITSLLSQGECLAFLGSGMSPDFMRWNQFVEYQGEQCGANLDALVGEEPVARYYRIAEESYQRDPTRYTDLLIQEYGRQPRYSRMAWTYVFQMGFEGFLTTNFDRHLLIEGSKYQLGYYDHLHLATKNIGKHLGYIHGIIHQDASSIDIIFKRGDYEANYNNNPGSLLNFLYFLFIEWDIIFIGYSLGDLALRELLKNVTEREQRDYLRDGVSLPERRRRYALFDQPYRQVPDDPATRTLDRTTMTARESEFREFGTEIIWFDPLDQTYSGLEELLQRCVPGTATTRLPTSPYRNVQNDKPTLR